MTTPPPAKAWRIMRILGRTLLGILSGALLLFFVLVLSLQLPRVQRFLVNKSSEFFQDKTQHHLSVENIYLNFDGSFQLKGLFVEDVAKDTLITSKSLRLKIRVLPLFFNKVHVDFLVWEGLEANVAKSSDSVFNFQYILDAFVAPVDSTDLQETELDSSKSSWLFQMDDIVFKDLQLQYADATQEMNATFISENLEISPSLIDVINSVFEVDRFHLGNAFVSFHQVLPFQDIEESETDTIAELPLFGVNLLSLENVVFDVVLPDKALDAKGIIGELQFSLPFDKTNLNTKTIETGPLRIANTVVDVLYASTETDTSSVNTKDSLPFVWPEWQVLVEEIVFSDLNVSAIEFGSSISKGIFNPKAVLFSELEVSLRDVTLSNELKGSIENLAFNEGSGLSVQHFETKITFSNSELRITNFDLQTPFNQLKMSGKVGYSSIDSLFEVSQYLTWDIQLDTARLGIQDAFYFLPELKNDSTFQPLVSHTPSFSLKAIGNNNEVNLQQFSFRWSNFTSLDLRGLLLHPFDSAALEIKNFTGDFSTKRVDYQQWIAQDQLEEQLPDTLYVSFNSFGNWQEIVSDIKLFSNLGEAELTTNMDLSKELPSYQIGLDLKDVQLAKLTGDSRFDEVNVALEVDGKGIEIKDLFATYSMELQSFRFNDYTYEKLNLLGSFANKQLSNSITYSDVNLDFTFGNQITFLKTGVIGDFQLLLNGANFTGLQLTEEDLRAAGSLAGRFSLDTLSQEFELTGTDFRVVKNRESFPIANVALNAYSGAGESRVKIDSEILKLTGNSNMTFEEMPKVLTNHFLSYYNSQLTDTILSDYYLNIDGNITNSRVLSEVFIPGLAELQPGEIHIHYSHKDQLFDAKVILPLINYAGLKIRDLGLKLDSKSDSLGLQLQFEELVSGPIFIPKTRVFSDIRPGQIDVSLNVKDSALKNIMDLGVEITRFADTQNIRLASTPLILNYQKWSIPRENRIWFSNSQFGAQHFILSNDSQYVSMADSTKGKTDLHIEFSQFKMSTFTSIFNTKNDLVNGELNGSLILMKPNESLAFLADLAIKDILINGIETGNLTLKSNNLAKDIYTIDLDIGGKGLEMKMDGRYTATKIDPRVDLSLDIAKAELKVLEAFSYNKITKTQGYLSGDLQLNGPVADWKYQGDIAFNNAEFFLNDLNTGFKLSDERLAVRDEKVQFNNFILRDAADNIARLSGSIDLVVPTNPGFDLKFAAKNFLFLDSKRENNDLFFGKLSLDMDVNVAGTALLPTVNATTRLNKGTALTFIVPESELAEIEREGVVLFTNVRNPEDPLTTFRGKNNQAQFFGLDLKAQVEVDKATTFRVIMDERSGDYISVVGGANLIFDLTPTGRMSLSGQYEVNEGRYELSFYDLVRRKFDFRKGSTITWSGDPLDGTLDLSAIYSVRTSAKDLMTAQITGADQTTQNSYRQELPFEVYLNIQGEMLQPEIGFALDMPQNSRGELGGNVYATVLQLNEDESELNKQVFSLLVLGGFLPETGGSSAGASTSIVRSSVSQLLSDQLNALSGKYIKGVDIELGLDSYTDFETGEGKDRTQLNVNVSKQLLDDRLIISVGSNLDLEGDRASRQQASDIIGNISLEYLLTEDGRYRFKAFRNNQFEGVFDGQIITTGISLRYSREFNRFSQIWGNGRKEEEVVAQPIDSTNDAK